MIIDWTKGAIQQLSTTLGERVWSWIGVSAASSGVIVSTRFDLIGVDTQKFSIIGVDNQKFSLEGASTKKFPLIGS